jgi:hypothetical protein
MMLMNLNRFLVRNRNSHGLLTNALACPKVQITNGHEDLNWTSTISMNCHLNASTFLYHRGLIE